MGPIALPTSPLQIHHACWIAQPLPGSGSQATSTLVSLHPSWSGGRSAAPEFIVNPQGRSGGGACYVKYSPLRAPVTLISE